MCHKTIPRSPYSLLLQVTHLPEATSPTAGQLYFNYKNLIRCISNSSATVRWAKAGLTETKVTSPPFQHSHLTRQCCRQTWSLDSCAIRMASWRASSACWLSANKQENIWVFPPCLKYSIMIQRNIHLNYTHRTQKITPVVDKACIFLLALQQYILVLRIISKTTSASHYRNATVTPKQAFKPCRCQCAKLFFEQGQC